MKERFLRPTRRVAFVTALWLTSISIQGGEFINLGFNDPDLSNAYDYVDPNDPLMQTGRVAPALEALRGWSITPSPTELLRDGVIYVDGGGGVLYLRPSIGGLVDRFGTYYMLMSDLASGGATAPPRPAITLSQVGMVPSGAGSLQYHDDGGGPFEVPIEVYLAGVRQTISTPGVLDVSAFAGTEVNLEFRFPEGFSYAFDIFGFAPVPEPTAWVLAIAGGVGLLALRRRRR